MPSPEQLLSFLYEHAFDKQLYCALSSERGELRLTWRAASPASWDLDGVSVPREELLGELLELGADLDAFERELRAVVSAHIVVADQLLRAAQEMLGPDAIPHALLGQRELTRELRAALTTHLRPRLRLVR